MSDFDTEKNKLDNNSDDSDDIIITTKETDFGKEKNGSSPAKSPDKNQKNVKSGEDENYLSEKLAQERRIQALMRMQNQNNSPPKSNNNEKSSLLKHSKTYGEDEVGGSRQRNDKGKPSPNKASQVETGFLSPQSQKASDRKNDSFDDYEVPQRTNSIAVDKPADYSSLLLPARNSDITKSVCVGKELKFMDKANWTDETKCYVCARIFNKMDGIFTHHCRACGRSVCGDCSTRKINENRACDVCFYKASNVLVEEKRKNLLDQKTRQIKEYKRKVEEAQKCLEELNQKKKELEKKIYEEREEQDNAFLNLQKEKVKVQETLDKKKSNNKKLKETIDAEQEALRKKEAETNEMKEILNSIKLDLAEKKGSINSKQEEAQRLAAQRQFYSCIDQNNASVLQRDLSVIGSCYPDLPGTEASNHVADDSMEGSSQEEMNE